MTRPRFPALILAAGYGTRLRPLSDRIAKPLLPVGGVSLLERAARRLVAAGCDALAVNAHHRANEVAAAAEALRLGVPVTVYRETEILGTGGPLGNARALLETGPRFLVHNGDVLSDLDLAALLAAHDTSGALATLALVDWPEVNTVTVGADGTVTAIGGDAPHGASGEAVAPAPGNVAGRPPLHRTYTGIAVFTSAFLDFIPEGPSSLVPALLRAMRERPGSVRGHLADPCLWNDLGTMRRYLDACRDAGPAPDAAAGAALRVDLARRAVHGDGWTVTEEENDAERLRLAAEAVLAGRAEGERITGHGSDRTFTRVKETELSAVLMQSPPHDEEFDRFVAVSGFLHAHGFGGPRVWHADRERRAAVLEDLGRRSLHAMVHEAGLAADRIEAIYRNVLDRLVDLQVRGSRLAEAGACPEAWDRRLDYGMLRWETDYFRARFLRDAAGMGEAELAALDEEFEALARSVDAQPVVLLHRDFQSQNILLQGDTVRLVDVQGMRRGPLLYDVMSLLRDAYVDLPEALREELLEFHRVRLAAAGGPPLDRAAHRAMAVGAGLQRNMQALGAFGFLSGVKGKVAYRDHIPLGLRHLRAGLEEAARVGSTPDLVRLRDLIDAVEVRSAFLSLRIELLKPVPETIAAVQRVIDHAPGYSLRACGRLPAPGDAEDLFTSRPSGCSGEAKYVFGVRAGGVMVGVLDAVRGHPDADSAFLGLLLFAESDQGKGYGAAALREFEAVVSAWPEVRRLRLAVLETNAGVIPFWERMGFARTGEVRPYRDGSVATEAILMEKRLG